MEQTGYNFDQTIDAWADITLKIWKQRLLSFGFSAEAGHLIDSLPDQGFVERHASGAKAKVSFFFNTYGRFVDMGVGSGFYKGNSGDADCKRKPKEWFAENWWIQVNRLKEIMAQKYLNFAVEKTMDAIDDIFGSQKTSKGMTYGLQQSIRNSKNYASRRALPGKWTNNYKTWKPI